MGLTDSPTPGMTEPTRPMTTPVSGRLRVWTPDRNRRQGLLVAALYQHAARVPCDRKAVIAGGLPRADKGPVLAAEGIEPDRYLTVSVDAVLLQMAEAGMIPALEGLAPLEAASLAHAEARYVLKRVALLAADDGRNLLFDIVMADTEAVDSWVGTLRDQRYAICGTCADITGEESQRSVAAEHRRGVEEFRRGRGYGGRFIPPAAIDALVRGDLAAAAPAIDDPERVTGDLYERLVLAYDQGKISDTDYADYAMAAAKSAA